MDYRKYYDRIIENAQTRILPEDHYRERHHIIPRCLGGDDKPENIVELTAREHYVIHQLLVKMYPNHHGIVHAAKLMTTDTNGNRVDNRLYEWLKIRISKQVSKESKKRWKNDEYREKIVGHISKNAKEKWKDPEYRKRMIMVGERYRQENPDHMEKMQRLAMKHWNDPENKRKQSEKVKGKNNPSYGTHWYHHPETLDEIRCKPEDKPNGYIKGKVKKEKPITQCIVCGDSTGSVRGKYCDKHRGENRAKNHRKAIKNSDADFGGYCRKATNEDIEKVLLENDLKIKLSMIQLGYKPVGYSWQRFKKVRDKILKENSIDTGDSNQ